MLSHVTIEELEVKVKSQPIILIDVRERIEYESGHIENAINIPMNELIKNHLSYLSYKNIYYLICQSGKRSSAVANFLYYTGYHVVNVFGGMNTYRGKLV